MTLFELIDSVDDLQAMQSHLYSKIILEILIGNEVNHNAIECKILKVFLVLRQFKCLIQPQRRIIGRPRFVVLLLHQLLHFRQLLRQRRLTIVRAHRHLLRYRELVLLRIF